jgi:hypothetical protein
LVAFLLLLAKLTIYAAELNPVLARRLWPRALPTCPPTPADDEVLRAIVHGQVRRPDERVGVGFDPDARDEVADDAGVPGVPGQDGDGSQTPSGSRRRAGTGRTNR